VDDTLPSIDLVLQITIFAFLYSLIIALIQKKFVYTPEYMRSSKMASELSRKILEAKKRGDTEALKKLQKKYEIVAKQAMKGSVKMIIVMILVILIFWGFLSFLNSMYGDKGSFIKIAFSIPPFIGETVDFFIWFIISSILFSRILSKLLKMY